MFVGHGLVAFAIAASLAAARGWTSDRALAVGLVAGLFATLPDVDMLYAVLGLVGDLEGVVAASDAFWAAAGTVHRGATHSVVVGTVAAVGFAAWRGREDNRVRTVALVTLVALVGGLGATSGPLTGAVMTAFVLTGLGVVHLAERFGFGSRVVFGAAALGLVSHPFGDLVTGQPPALFYPLDIVVLTGRVTLHADPTVHLLGAFFVELVTIWLALVVFTRLRGVGLRSHVRPRAALGVGYALAVFVLPAPTLEVSSPFVFSVLAVGVVGLPLGRSRSLDDGWVGRHGAVTAIATALTAVSLAGVAYAGAYLVVLA